MHLPAGMNPLHWPWPAVLALSVAYCALVVLVGVVRRRRRPPQSPAGRADRVEGPVVRVTWEETVPLSHVAILLGPPLILVILRIAVGG